jgi:hypothetical protein
MRFMKKTLHRPLAIGAALSVLAFSVFAIVHPGLAQDAESQLAAVAAGGGLPTTNIAILIARIIRVFLGTLGIIFTVLIAYAGFIYMTAQGEVEKVKRATKMIKNGVIGMIICLSAFSITQFILNRLLEAASGAGGTQAIADQYSEPLSGSLGAGIIDSHYPERYALEIPRNTRIMVTFKEAINPADIISGYDTACETGASTCATDLNASNVLIYPTGSGETAALTATDAIVSINDDHTIFVFDPVDLLGSAAEDTNYTVALTNDIRKEATDTAAFTGNYSGGYEWTFEVSTEVDLTPPQVVSISPGNGDEEARNVTVAITFNEAMDPVAGTGTYDDADDSPFRNIEVTDVNGNNVEGTFSISDGYRTIEFTPVDACAEDPCGDPIYCLPGDDSLTVEAKAATLGDEPPQALSIGASFDGLVDASANSLDGDGDDTAEGPDTDSYLWVFTTTDEINDEVPVIESMSPGILEEFADADADVHVNFSLPMRSSTLNTTNISLWPDPWYEFWFSVSKTDVDTDLDGSNDYTTADIAHPTMVSHEDEGWNYYPVVTRGVKSTYQICMFPAYAPSAYDETDTACRGDSASNTGVTDDEPYCCNGASDDAACRTSGTDSNLNSVTVYDLPDTSD